MDQSYSENDLSLSPSQIFERLQMLRQLQILQRGKLQKHCLQYQEPSENSSSITEIVSHFTNSTGYNTFRSLLQSSHDVSTEGTLHLSELSNKVKESDLIEGVSLLNLSQESAQNIKTPNTNKSTSVTPRFGQEAPILEISLNNVGDKNTLVKQISLDDMPILSPKKDFEAMVLEKLQIDNIPTKKGNSNSVQNKKPFLRRGEGMSRFGINKKDLVIQNTKSLPWRRKSFQLQTIQSPVSLKKSAKTTHENEDIQTLDTERVNKLIVSINSHSQKTTANNINKSPPEPPPESVSKSASTSCESPAQKKASENNIHMPKGKYPLLTNKGKTWAAVLTNEQNDLLKQLKQSEYYKNFASPAKSTFSDASCDENISKLRQEKEIAEQNMFELLENKVSNESFNLENSFFNRFLRKSNLECSGESTPLIMQKCLSNNPNLLHLLPDLNFRKRNDTTHSETESCQSDCTECCSDACSSALSCCSCKTIEPANNNNIQINKKFDTKQKSPINKVISKEVGHTKENNCQNNNVESDTMKANIVEMNAKLITTSELLKDRLRELEDEIETFRKENVNLSKLREEIDLERKKFYEEKSAFQQKFNEEKILSEYYLAEEKDKLNKQKQIYDRQVREMRGRLNKRDKDEVLNLKQEINNLKEEMNLKDAKSTSTIARLRNQMKIMEKDKKDLLANIENLKKENRRIQHSNDITRRMTNMKYLEEINKKLSHMSKETQSEVNLDNDIKYKAYEIERQSRSKKIQPAPKNGIRPRAKSVPNLKVTSRYAKYFSQRDVVSEMERNKTCNTIQPILDTHLYGNEYMESNNIHENDSYDSDSNHNVSDHDNDDENHLEKIYMETFRSNSPKSNRSSISNPGNSCANQFEKLQSNDYFIRKSNSSRDSKSPINNSLSPNIPYIIDSNLNRSNSPTSTVSYKSSDAYSKCSQNSIEHDNNVGGSNAFQRRSKSPISILSNHSSLKSTVIHKDLYRDKMLSISPEPSTSKISLTKTNLNPTEIRKPDGSKELRFPNGNIKYISADGKYSKFVYYNGDIKENFYSEGRIKYFYAETKTFHTTHPDGLEVLEFPDGQVEKRYKNGSLEVRLNNGIVRYSDPNNKHVSEEWKFPDGSIVTTSANGEKRVAFPNGQVEVQAKDHKRREYPDGTVKIVFNDGSAETRYQSGRVRIKDRHGKLLLDSRPKH